MTPTPEDLALDVLGLLDCAGRAEREGRTIQTWNCMSIIAGLCRRVIAAEEERDRLADNLQRVLNRASERGE